MGASMNQPSRETRVARTHGKGQGADHVVDVSQFHAGYLGSFNIIFFSTWVAVCAAAPEFIWQGFLTIIHHFSWVTAASAMLVGAIVAFFVEPLTERLREMRLHVMHRHRTPTHATFAAFGFAVLAVCVHEAITSFVASSSADHRAEDSLFFALSEVFQWASIPFAITVAWLCVGRSRWISWVALLLAAFMSSMLGFISDWSVQDSLTTAIPCTCILFWGWGAMRKYSTQLALSRCARLTAIIACIWLASAGIVQLGLWLFAPANWHVYSWAEYAIDLRFYLGWVIGLAVAPRPVAHH
jgi:hypothetical protein